MKKYLLIATALVALASCTDENFVGENGPNGANGQNENGAIAFGFDLQKTTRADIAGSEAATLLGGNFYVMGTKADMTQDPAIPTNSPTTIAVFDNYLVHYDINTAGRTKSNTANWEYVGIDQASATASERLPENYDRVKLSSTTGAQTIKFWDYSASQYDFLAFSTGTKKAVKDKAIASVADEEINVTPIAYGSSLASNGIAYTFGIPTIEALKNAFITDITKVEPANYRQEVTLKFKNLGSKVRMALYETVPGYSVKDVVFYTVDGTTDFTDASKNGTAKLIGDNNNSFPTKGTIQIYFPHVGSSNISEQDYNMAAATVTAADGTYDKFKTFGALTAQLVAKERAEAGGDNVFLGRSLTTATYAGDDDAAFYETVFPISTPYPITLRVDYTLVPIDGAAEVIYVKGAKAVVPSTYTKWLPNYAYTYIFKISDNTNGWTGTSAQPAGLFPITFDAVVTEATDANAEQATITTVATPTITTYQQNHDPTAQDEYDNDGANLYVQVMDNSTSPATLKGNLNGSTPDATNRSLLYAVTVPGKTYNSQPSGWPTGYYTDAACTTAASSFSTSTTYYQQCTEATVMDALQNQANVTSGTITGRNDIVLEPNNNMSTAVTNILNGPDNNPIPVSAGQAAKITIDNLTAGTYAYVYDYSTAAKTTTDIYQPIAVEVGTTDVEGVKYVSNTYLGTWDDEATADHYTSSENAAAGYLYFSITTNGGATKTYSFISVDDKIGTALPDGLLKLPVSKLSTGAASETADADTFYFTIYTRNTGKYAVKVIKVVD